MSPLWWCRNAITPASSLPTGEPTGSLGCHLYGGAETPSHPLLPFRQVSQQDHWDVTFMVVQKRHHTRFFPTDRWLSLGCHLYGGAETPSHTLLPYHQVTGPNRCPDHLHGGAEMPLHLLLTYRQVRQQDHWDVTFMVVQKRHHTSFFPTDRRGR